MEPDQNHITWIWKSQNWDQWAKSNSEWIISLEWVWEEKGR